MPRRVSIVGLFFCAVTLTRAATWYVAPGGDDTAAGIDWTTAFATISNAVARANMNAGDVVLISNGTYTLTATNIFITNAVTMRSWHDGVADRESTMINGGGGGGVMFVNRATAVTNSIVFSNKTGAAWTDFDFFNGTATLYYCCTPVTNTSLMADNCVTNSPRYVNFPDGNYRLAAISPCINAGLNQDWMTNVVDLLGRRPRIYYGRVDIGCYEYFLDVKVNGVPMDRIKSINGIPRDRIIKINGR